MPPRSRYAVDPSLTAQAQGQQYQQQDDQQPGYQQNYHDPNVNPILHPVSDRRSPAPTGPYAPSGPPSQPHYAQQQVPLPEQLHASYIAPSNHIPPPPHSSGPQVSGPRVRIDPSQMPNPIETQDMDQNLYDEEDFLSCQTRGVIPLAGTDWRGIDQGELPCPLAASETENWNILEPASYMFHAAMQNAPVGLHWSLGNSLPRHLRATLPVIPANSQLLETTALPFALILQPFAQLRYDEAPVPLVSNWVSGESAFDAPKYVEEEEAGPPRCEKCRGYINPWVRWMDGGRKWACNLCGATNNGELRKHAEITN